MLWTASGRARDDILEASASVEARGAWLHVETIDVDGELAAEALAQTLRRMRLRRGDARRAAGARDGRGAARGRVVRRGRY